MDKLLVGAKKEVKVHKKFDPSVVKKIVSIGYPMEVLDPKRHKTYKLLCEYQDIAGKVHDKTIYFGERIRKGGEFINHKNEQVRDEYIKNLKNADTFFDKYFMEKWLLNGEKSTIGENWEILKRNYINSNV